MKVDIDYRVVVIGAGPAGISAISECTYHKILPCILLEKGTTHNQTVHKYYPDDKRVDAAYKGQDAVCDGVVCFKDTTKKNFLEVMDDVFQSFPSQIVYNTEIESIKRADDGKFLITDTRGRSYSSLNVIISIGKMGKPNKPDYFKNIPATVKKKVRFDVNQIDATGKEILVVGGGNSAIEFALSLSPKGKVTVSYRRDVFERLNDMNAKLFKEEREADKVEVLTSSNIEGIGDQDGCPLVRFKEGGERSFDEVVFAIGGSSPGAFLGNAGIDVDQRGNPILDKHNESSVPNLYVVGELSVPPGKGSIIRSFNTSVTAVKRIMEKMNLVREPEIVTISDVNQTL